MIYNMGPFSGELSSNDLVTASPMPNAALFFAFFPKES